MIVAELAIGVTVLGFFLAPNISKLMEVARDCAVSKYELDTGKRKKLLKLAKDLEGIKSCFLDPATLGGFVNNTEWLDSLWRLKDAIHDAEEILDLFESHILELEASENLKKRRDGASSSKKSTDTSSSKAPSMDQLNKVLESLEGLREMARDLRENHNAILCPINDVESARCMGQDPVRDRKLFFGYDNEYEKLVSMLRVGNTDKKVIAIIGHGGMGKTELARQAFRDVQGNFELLIWVPAYGKKTELAILSEIWKSAASAISVGQMNVPSLQTELKKLWTSKKCLLVLDDVWNDERASSELERKQAWNGLRSLLGDESKIVMTTRAKICSTTLCADASIILNGIKPKEITLLVNDTAKLSTDCTIRSERKVQDLLDRQVLKFKGSPLAAMEIGEELKKQTTRDERCKILNTIDQHIGSVLKGHLFTYHNLPPHLQRCLAFCSIFPYNWRFEPEKLTKMWMALGFVEESVNHLVGMSSMEDIARGYFNSLVDRSLFHSIEEGSSSTGEGDKQTYYVIHEQIHWMLRVISAKNCISISRGSASHSAGAASSKRSIPRTVRHLSVTSGCLGQLKEYTTGLSNLRTLLVLKDDDGSTPAPSIDKTLLKEFKGVRVLDLTETGITQLPENIGKLKHVRYLGLPGTISSDLCDEVTKLLFLQTLSVGDKSNDKTNDKKKKDYIANISGIGRLSKLRESIEFQVKRGSEKDGHSVSELAGMNSLGETLTIKGLDAVASKKEAEEAGLGTKLSVKILKLEWGPLSARQVDCRPAAVSSAATAAADPAAAVLEGLQPHPYIHELRITRYPGETSPASTWLSRMERLTRLYLQNCRKLKALPALGGLQCLELLVIKEFTAVERIDGDFCGGGRAAFQKLKKIVLDDMPKLVAWDDMPRDAFPQLRDVSIVDCPKLSSLSGLGCCGGPIRLSVRGCKLITPRTLPAKFSAGVSTCKFH